MANCHRGHAWDPPGNMHSPAFCLLTAREWGGACTIWSSGRSDAIPIIGVFPFMTFLSLTLSKGLFTSNLPILRFLEIGFFPKMEKYWAVPPKYNLQGGYFLTSSLEENVSDTHTGSLSIWPRMWFNSMKTLTPKDAQMKSSLDILTTNPFHLTIIIP